MFLVKVQAYQGEPANEQANIQTKETFADGDDRN